MMVNSRIEVAKPHVAVEQIPPVLKSIPHWVCWKYIERAGKKTKCPVNAVHGWNASSTDPNSRCTFDEALAAFQKSDTLAGVGFVFSANDPFCGIDLDDCLDAEGNMLWGQDIIEMFDTYTEVSPSGRGVKLVFRGKKPMSARCKADWHSRGEVEVYDNKRVFTVTGQRFADTPAEINDRQDQLDALCNQLWPVEPAITDDRAERCLEAMQRMRIVDHNDGSHRLHAACCRAVEHDLADGDAVATVRAYEVRFPFPKDWSDSVILRRVRDAERLCERGVALRGSATEIVRPEPPSLRELMVRFPELRPPVIHNLLRQGETANVISAPKIGKSWLVTDLALAVATGRPWLDAFETEPGHVLIIDNELHGETTANRIPKVAKARGILLDDVGDCVFVENLRGRLKDIILMRDYFHALDPGRFRIIVIDAFYRAMPANMDENDNGTMASVYNHLDAYANRLGCCFVLVHHSSKGNQSAKAVTDVGAGAGSQSRATDTHLILRQYEEDDCVVIDAAVRSWPPIEPRCLRWAFPIFTPDDSLDPKLLKSPRSRRRARREPREQKPEWDVEKFVAEFITDELQEKFNVITAAIDAGLSERKAERLLKEAVRKDMIHRHQPIKNKPASFSLSERVLVETS